MKVHFMMREYIPGRGPALPRIACGLSHGAQAKTKAEVTCRRCLIHIRNQWTPEQEAMMHKRKALLRNMPDR